MKKMGIYEQGLNMMSKVKIIEVVLAWKFLGMLLLSLNLILIGLMFYSLYKN